MKKNTSINKSLLTQNKLNTHYGSVNYTNNSLADLPEEMIGQISEFMTLFQAFRLSQVNHHLHDAVIKHLPQRTDLYENAAAKVSELTSKGIIQLKWTYLLIYNTDPVIYLIQQWPRYAKAIKQQLKLGKEDIKLSLSNIAHMEEDIISVEVKRNLTPSERVLLSTTIDTIGHYNIQFDFKIFTHLPRYYNNLLEGWIEYTKGQKNNRYPILYIIPIMVFFLSNVASFAAYYLLSAWFAYLCGRSYYNYIDHLKFIPSRDRFEQGNTFDKIIEIFMLTIWAMAGLCIMFIGGVFTTAPAISVSRLLANKISSYSPMSLTAIPKKPEFLDKMEKRYRTELYGSFWQEYDAKRESIEERINKLRKDPVFKPFEDEDFDFRRYEV